MPRQPIALTEPQEARFQLEADWLLGLATAENDDPFMGVILEKLIAQARNTPGATVALMLDVADNLNAALIRIKEAG